MGDITIPIAGETLQRIYQKKSYFDSVIEMNETLELGIMPSSEDSRIEVSKLKDDKVRVDFYYAIDNDYDPSNGRLYMVDRFTFKGEGSDRAYKSFERDFEYNQLGSNHKEWKKWAKKFGKTKDPAKLEKQLFAESIARLQGLSINEASRDDFIGILKENPSILEHLTEVGLLAQSVYPDISVKGKSSLNNYSVVQGDEGLELTVSFLLDDDKDPGNGSLWIHEYFLLDSETFKLKSYERKWSIPVDFQRDPLWSGVVESLREKSAPSLVTAKAYIQPMLSMFIPKQVLPEEIISEKSNSTPPTNTLPKVKKSRSVGIKVESLDKEGTQFLAKVQVAEKGERKDTPESLKELKLLKATKEGVHTSVRRDINVEKFTGKVIVEIDNSTGNVKKIWFQDLMVAGSYNDEQLDQLITDISASISRKVSLKKQKDEETIRITINPVIVGN